MTSVYKIISYLKLDIVMKNIILLVCFFLCFSMLKAQENGIKIRREKGVLINENQRIRVKIKHPRKNRLKKVSGQFQFSKNNDSILLQRYFFTKKHKIAIDDIVKIKRHSLVMAALFNTGFILIGTGFVKGYIVTFSSTIVAGVFIFGIVLPTIAYQVFVNGLNLSKSYNLKNKCIIEYTQLTKTIVEK